MLILGRKEWYIYEHMWYAGLRSLFKPGRYPDHTQLPGGHDRASSARIDEPSTHNKSFKII